MSNIFTACRQLVSAEAVARHFGLKFDRYGKARCPFHDDLHPSMSFRNSTFRCWSCGASGDCIDFTGKLFGLTPLATVKLLDHEFSLNLPINRPLTGKEIRQQRERSRLRRQQQETLQEFEKWRFGLLGKLTGIIRAAGQIQAKNIDEFTAGQIELLHQLAAIEHLADVLQFGNAAEIMDIFRERKAYECQIQMILSNMQPKLAAA